MDVLPRPLYLNRLIDYIDKPQIKILRGIRRSGKSSVLIMIRQELLSRGIEADRIIHLNLESWLHTQLHEAKTLYGYIQQQITKTDKYYILLDEIQEVKDWEKAVNSFLVDFNVDVYLTGSNSHLLSLELATYLAGRYVEIPIYTLSFAEFLQFRQHYLAEKPSDTRAGTYTIPPDGRIPGYPHQQLR